MTLSLIQFRDDQGRRGVAALRDGGAARPVANASSTLALARSAIRHQESMERAVERLGVGQPLDLASVTLLAPVDHPDPAHLLLTGTGLTHLGSAEQRDRMHRAIAAGEAPQTDSMKMFRMGVDGGKPAPGRIGVQPEWFYKGDGASLIAPGEPLPSPDFARDGGEEPEIAGVYLIAEDGSPLRLGFALANEFSDHVTERENYLWLAHSKLRPASIGPELLVTPLPSSVVGTSRILREGVELWSRPFLSGEDNMSHSIANLEHHHFKYASFRRPGDVHVHFFGTGTLSFGDGIRTHPGDVFEIRAAPFTLPLRNAVGTRPTPDIVVRPL